MSIQVASGSENDIIIVTMQDEVTTEQIQVMFRETAELIAHLLCRPIYRIIDLRSIHVPLGNLMEFLSTSQQNTPGSPSDSRLKDTFVGKEGMAQLYIDFVRKKSGNRILIPMYKTIEEALEAIAHQKVSSKNYA